MKLKTFFFLICTFLVGSTMVTACDDKDSSDYTPPLSQQDRVYVGVVAFNDKVTTFPIANNLTTAKTFISGLKNDVDRTALCYAVSKATTLFGVTSLPKFDKIFIVSFTDGIDNGSSSLYQKDGKTVPQAIVYDQAKTDLSAKTGLVSYAIGFGSEVNQTDMKKLVTSGGEYKTATSSSLNSTFRDIANSVLASSKNFVLKTQDGVYTAAYPKYFRITVTAKSGSTTYTDKVVGKLVDKTFTIVTPGSYVAFDVPVTGKLNGNKIEIPLNNLKYTRSGVEYIVQENIKVEVSTTSASTGYYEDVEDSSASSDISKTIGVVLVLDCSTSLGSAFSTVLSSANDFINTLGNAK